VQVEVRIFEKADLRSEVKKGNRSAYLTDWGSAYFDPYDLAQPKITTNGRGNFSFYSNSKVDELLKLAASSNDTSIRKKAYYKIQDIIYKDAPWVFGYILPNFEAAGPDVVNYKPSMDNRVNLHDVSHEQGDTIIVGMNTNAFLSLDPIMYRSRETETMIRNMFDGVKWSLNWLNRGSKLMKPLTSSLCAKAPSSIMATPSPSMMWSLPLNVYSRPT
jgi:peptide/nickel transport system substrate-binding protein